MEIVPTEKQALQVKHDRIGCALEIYKQMVDDMEMVNARQQV